MDLKTRSYRWLRVSAGGSALLSFLSAVVLSRMLPVYGLGSISFYLTPTLLIISLSSIFAMRWKSVIVFRSAVAVLGVASIGFLSYAFHSEVLRLYFWLPASMISLFFVLVIYGTPAHNLHFCLKLIAIMGFATIVPLIPSYYPAPFLAPTRDLLNENQLSMYLLSFSILLFVAQEKNFARFAIFVTVAIAIVMESRGTILAGVIFLLLDKLVLRQKRFQRNQLMVGIPVMLISIGLFLPALLREIKLAGIVAGQDLALTGRLAGLQNSLTQFLESPVLGAGVPAELDLNSYTALLGQHGLTGFLIVITWIFTVVVFGFSKRHDDSMVAALSGFLSLLAYSCFEPILGSFGNPAGITIFFLGYLLISGKSRRISVMTQ